MDNIRKKLPQKNHAILLVHCQDQRGIVSTVTEFLDKNNGNIIDLDEHVDHVEGVFFMRVEWELNQFSIPKDKIGEYFNTLIAEKYQMKWELHFTEKVPRMAILVSKMPHCLFDLLARYIAGEWHVEIPMIISNHPDLQPIAEHYNIPFHIFPITKANKAELEPQEIALLKEQNIDFVVLARYMQVLSADFIKEFPNKVINIHHSFLPAFPGAKPYHSAHQRGVKIIGATSHYVTSDLDEGPIIDQGVVQIDHKDTVENLVRKGRDNEKIVLSRAVYAHLRRKTLVYHNRTIVFN